MIDMTPLKEVPLPSHNSPSKGTSFGNALVNQSGALILFLCLDNNSDPFQCALIPSIFSDSHLYMKLSRNIEFLPSSKILCCVPRLGMTKVTFEFLVAPFRV